MSWTYAIASTAGIAAGLAFLLVWLGSLVKPDRSLEEAVETIGDRDNLIPLRRHSRKSARADARNWNAGAMSAPARSRG